MQSTAVLILTTDTTIMLMALLRFSHFSTLKIVTLVGCRQCCIVFNLIFSV